MKGPLVFSGWAFNIIRIYLQLKKEEPMQVHQIRDGDVISVLERFSSKNNNNNNTEMSLEPHLNQVVVETTTSSSTEVITSEFFKVVERHKK
jgi:hypothetical protein